MDSRSKPSLEICINNVKRYVSVELDITLEDHNHAFRPRQRTLRERLKHTMSHCYDG
nr:hypothetical protein Q903MT_gene4406 [Picea sitchensis]